MRPSKWLVFIRPSLAGFDRPLTTQGKLDQALAEFRTVLQPDPANISAQQQIVSIEAQLHPDH
jgi:hypothetical protein